MRFTQQRKRRAEPHAQRGSALAGGYHTLIPSGRWTNCPDPGTTRHVESVGVGLGGAVLNTAIVAGPIGPGGCHAELRGGGFVGGAGIGTDAPNRRQTGLHPRAARIGQRTDLFSRHARWRAYHVLISAAPIRAFSPPEDLPEQAFERASILHISGYSLLEAPQKDAVWARGRAGPG